MSRDDSLNLERHVLTPGVDLFNHAAEAAASVPTEVAVSIFSMQVPD